MEPTSVAALPWLVSIGFALLGINWLVGPALYGPLWLGRPMSDFTRMLFDTIHVGAVMLMLGAVTVVAYEPAGLWALAGFAMIAVLPQSALTFALRPRPVARLGRHQATRAYAGALAVQLRLTREQRRHLIEVAKRLERRPATGEPLDFAVATSRNPGDTRVVAAELVNERWNGTGKPIGLRGTLIPLQRSRARRRGRVERGDRGGHRGAQPRSGARPAERALRHRARPADRARGGRRRGPGAGDGRAAQPGAPPPSPAAARAAAARAGRRRRLSHETQALRRMNAATVAASGDHVVAVPNSMSQPCPAVAGSTITRLVAERARRATSRMSATGT